MKTINMIQIIGFSELKHARQYVIFYTNKKSECRGSWHSLAPKEQRFILNAYRYGRWSRNYNGRLFMHSKTPSDDFSTVRTQRARIRELYAKNYSKKP